MAMSQERAAQAEQLKKQILQCIEDGVRFSPHIAKQLGESKDTINSALRRMEQSGRISHVRVTTRAMGGYMNRWSLVGENGPIEDGDPLQHGEQRVVKTHKTYPVVGRCDPLVAYLFGLPLQAPKQSPHRCTACGVEQGEQHQRGCIVALVAA